MKVEELRRNTYVNPDVMYKIMLALRQGLCNKKNYHLGKCRLKFSREHCRFHSRMRAFRSCVPLVRVRASAHWACVPSLLGSRQYSWLSSACNNRELMQ